MSVFQFGVFEWVNLTALLIGVLASIITKSYMMRIYRTAAEHELRIPPTVILFYGLQFTSTGIWTLLTFGERSALTLSVFEIALFAAVCMASAYALVTQAQRCIRTGRVWRLGFIATASSISSNLLLQSLAYPFGTLDIRLLFGGFSILVLLVTGAVSFHLAIKYKNTRVLSAPSYFVLSVTILLGAILASQVLPFRSGSFQGVSDGLDAARLQCLLVMLIMAAFSLSIVIGSNPRQHWRRYSVTIGLVIALSGSVYYFTGQTMAQVTRYFELGRLLERVEKLGAELEIARDKYAEVQNDSTIHAAIPANVFKALESYAIAVRDIDDGMRAEAQRSDLAQLYFDASEEGMPSVRDMLMAVGEHSKAGFGLQHTRALAAKYDEDSFERDVAEFSELILVRAASTNAAQQLIQDMSFTGGIFLVTFMALGVFIPAHTSTTRTLDELENEKRRIEKLAICAEQTTKGVVLVGRNGGVTWCNDAFVEMTGYRLSELQGKSLIEKLHHEDSDPAVLESMLLDLTHGRSTEFEVLARRKNHEEFWLKATITPIRENGKIRQFVHVIEDVTEARAMSKRLQDARKENDRLALIAKHATDGMAIISPDGSFAWINPAMVQMTGYSLEELRAVPLHELLSGPLSDKHTIRRILEALPKRQLVSAEILVYPKSGPPYWIEAIHTPIFEADGKYSGYVIVHRDITERKNLELELISNRDDLAARVQERTQTIHNQALELEKALAKERELNAIQAEFVSMASHEFRTPLTIIDGLARRIAKHAGRFTPEQTIEKAQNIRNAVKRMTMLVERTLDASRLSSGRIRLMPEEFDLPRLLNEVISRQRDVAPTHTIEADINDLPETLFGDARLMDNVFTNIVSNAVKYSGDTRKVEIHGYQKDGYAVVSVKDYGLGIPKDEMPKIFQRFFRASTSTGIPGTGIGLNLVKSLVEMHYGLIQLESEEGEWTEMTVSLPLESPLQDAVSEVQEECDEMHEGGAQVA